MRTKLPTSSLTVADLLAGPMIFSIPPYQRAYAWTREEGARLLDDLLEAADVAAAEPAEPDYFLGSVLLMDPSGAGWDADPASTAATGPRRVDIVDGQQRIVTLTILAAVLRDLEAQPEDELWSRLDAMIAVPGTGRPGGPRRLSRLVLPSREQAVLERIVLLPGATASPLDDDETDVAGAEAMAGVRDHFAAILGDLERSARRRLAHYLIERTHVVGILAPDADRAHRYFLVLNDRGRMLYKSDILKAEVLHAVPAGDAAAAVAGWNEASALLGPRFDDFFGHLKAIQGQARPQVITAARRLVTESGGAAAFVSGTLLPLAASYRLIVAAGGADGQLPPDLRRRLVYLSRLNGEDWAPAAMLALRAWLDGRREGAAALAEIDRLAHVLRLLTIGGDKRQRRFAPIVAALKAGAVIDESSPLVAISRDELRGIASNLKALWRKNPAFSKLVLLRLSDELAGGLTDIDPAELSVEHVLPQRPGQGTEWRRMFPDTETRERLTQSLGNLVLLTRRQNDAARAHPFTRKQEIYARRDNGRPPLALLDDVLAARVWDAAAIRAREARLKELVARTFRLEMTAGALAR